MRNLTCCQYIFFMNNSQPLNLNLDAIYPRIAELEEDHSTVWDYKKQMFILEGQTDLLKAL